MAEASHRCLLVLAVVLAILSGLDELVPLVMPGCSWAH
jgi:hypothetical protein